MIPGADPMPGADPQQHLTQPADRTGYPKPADGLLDLPDVGPGPDDR